MSEDDNTMSIIVIRLLQSNSTTSVIFRKALATILGLLGLLATLALTYLVALLCDTSVRLFTPVPDPSTDEARRSAQGEGLDRDRMDATIKKKIVQELFANETFLYSSSSPNKDARRQDGADVESGIELKEMASIQNGKDTAETDDESLSASQPLQSSLTNESATTPPLVSENENNNDSEMFDSTNSEPACCICLALYRDGDLMLRSKHCTHMYHASCCEDWILQKPVCPLCAKPMILDAEWEATAASVLGQERYNAMLLEQREGRREELNETSSSSNV